uniref:DOMON domain-containing protein n=1 Tax=Caenorhabditis japonica TaxID=281687 RepID=A0A8R1HYF8_CAEJA
VVDGELTIEVTTDNMGNNEWSAVGFGPDMSDLSVVVFQVKDSKPSVVTGATQGYGAPALDSTPSVNLQSVNYNSHRYHQLRLD